MGKFIPPSPRPLVPQHPPVGVFREYVMPHPTTLVLQEKVLDWSGDGFRIMDSNGAVVAKCKGKSFSMHDRTSEYQRVGAMGDLVDKGDAADMHLECCNTQTTTQG